MSLLPKRDNDQQHGSDEWKGLYRFEPFTYRRIRPSGSAKVPYPRSGHRIGADSMNFYSFGGYNPLVQHNDDNPNGVDDYYVQTFPLFKELWKFNFASKRWTQFPNTDSMPMELASNALLLHRNFLMVYGGTGSPFGFRCSNQLYMCKVNDNIAAMKEVQATGQAPTPQYGQAIIYHNDYLYTIGGTTGLTYTCDIHRLNMKNGQWEIVYLCTGEVDFEPKGRYRHEVGFDGRNICILGGGTAESSYGFKNVPSFNLEKREWVKRKTIKDSRRGIPAARKCHGAVQITTERGVEVFITGGHNGEHIFDDLWRLDLQTFQWTYFETCHLPRPTYFHATSVSPEGRLYVFGGIFSYNIEDVRRTNAIYSTWLCIPKLSEICWEALLHYCPHIVDSSSDELINSGLPRRFVQRLQM